MFYHPEGAQKSPQFPGGFFLLSLSFHEALVEGEGTTFTERLARLAVNDRRVLRDEHRLPASDCGRIVAGTARRARIVRTESVRASGHRVRKIPIVAHEFFLMRGERKRTPSASLAHRVPHLLSNSVCLTLV